MKNDEKIARTMKKKKTEKKPEGSPSLLSAIAGVTVYVFSDSVLCLEKKGHNPVESWKKQIQWYSDTNYTSTGNLCNRFFGGGLLAYALQILAPVELFYKQLNGCSFRPGRNYCYFRYSVLRACFVTSTLCY